MVVEPKPKRKYKTKKEKDKNIVFKKLTTLKKAMVEDELCEEEVQSLKEIVEEEVTMTTISTISKWKRQRGRMKLGWTKC